MLLRRSPNSKYVLLLRIIFREYLSTFFALGFDRMDDLPVSTLAPTKVTLQGETGLWTSISESSESEEEEEEASPWSTLVDEDPEAPPSSKITPGS